MVEFNGDFSELFITFFREGLLQVLHHHLFPVAEEVVDDEEEEVGNAIGQPEGQDGHEQCDGTDEEVSDESQSERQVDNK